jgi:chorismate dehydratase
VAAVSYLNTKPLLYGFEGHPVMENMNLSLEIPSVIASKLIDGTVDLGLVPVAAIPRIPNANIISGYGIGAKGKVASVCIFSHCPIEEMTHLYLDFHSRTSVRLAQVLLKEHWKVNVELIQAQEGYIDEIKGTIAGVIIGDRALQQLENFPYIYDLSEHWTEHTGLPFIFAAWVANKTLPDDFKKRFDEANSIGVGKIEEVSKLFEVPYYDIHTYYTDNIHFKLTPEYFQGLELFLEKIEALGLV